MITKLDDLPQSTSEHDRREVEKFMGFLRQVSAAKRAGVPHDEAVRAIYPDAYPDDDKAVNKT